MIGAWKAALTKRPGWWVAWTAAGRRRAHRGDGEERQRAGAANTALNGVIKNGDYDKVLNRWGEGVERLDRSEINPPGLGD